MAVIEKEIEDRYAIYNGDSCEVLPSLKSESIHLSIYSPPFAELYNYSSSPRDLSNCKSYDEFLDHYRFIVKEIARVTKPGRVSAVHCMDLKNGVNGQRDFPGDIIRIHEEFGMNFQSRRFIWKEPLAVAIRTRQKGLMHRQIVKDASVCNVAGADYLLTFLKVGQNKEPIEHPMGLTYYAGETDNAKRARLGLGPFPHGLKAAFANHDDQKTNGWSHWIWRRYASSVWMDIRSGHVLPYRAARESEEEKHVCPLQLDVIERIIQLYSNPNDVVLTPFMGVGSEVFTAVRTGRRGVGIELKPTYFRQSKINVKYAMDHPFSEEEDMLSGLDFGKSSDENTGPESMDVLEANP